MGWMEEGRYKHGQYEVATVNSGGREVFWTAGGPTFAFQSPLSPLRTGDAIAT